jgi:hypothetical protein
MRSCAKMSCQARPVATIELQYAAREVIVRDLRAERDPNLLDLCREHVERMTPPLGWTLHDERTLVPASP